MNPRQAGNLSASKPLACHFYVGSFDVGKDVIFLNMTIHKDCLLQMRNITVMLCTFFGFVF